MPEQFILVPAWFAPIWIAGLVRLLRNSELHWCRAVGVAWPVLATLPVLPVSVVHDTPIVVLNYDAGETIGWPAFVAEIAAVYRSLPPASVGPRPS